MPADPGAAQLEVVEFSGGGRLLAGQPLLLPTASNVRKLSAALTSELGRVLRRAGISPQPPVEFALLPDGSLQVKGGGPEAGRIARLLEDHPDLERRIRTVVALSSHACQLAEGQKFQQEYRAASNPEAVVARYRYLFGPRPAPAISLRFDGRAAQVLVDGRVWPAEEG